LPGVRKVVVTQSALHQTVAETPAVGEQWLREPGGERLLALTRDDALIQSLEAVAPDGTLSVVGNEPELTARLLGDIAGVAILDAAATQTPLAELTTRLRAQFPDLVLIVAGGLADQAAISAQVTAGTVYRFLHKPVSVQRVKLFVDAARKRHDVEHAATGTFSTLQLKPESAWWPGKKAIWVGAGVGLAAAAAVAIVVLSSSQREPAPRAARADAAAQRASLAARVNALLERADSAFNQGELTTPPGESAADLYQQALHTDAQNARAQAGIARVCDALLTGAEQALLAGQLDEAQRLTDAAHGLAPELVRVAFLDAQIAKERERAHPPPPPARPATAAATANAPETPAAVAPGLHKAADSALQQARAALQAGALDDTDRLLRAAADAGADADELAPLQREVQTARIAAKAALMTRLYSEFTARLVQGRLLGPAGDSARFYLDQLTAADPVHPSTVLAREALAARMLTEARAALTHSDLKGAQDFLTEARALGALAAEATNVEQAIATARSEPTAPVLAEAGELQRTRYVAPEYPDVAEKLGRKGLVELEFIVRADGSVANVTVVHAEPAGVFDAAAVKAVRQWRYRPVLRDGHAVEQRARLRINFAP
jgi:TonB family protein